MSIFIHLVTLEWQNLHLQRIKYNFGIHIVSLQLNVVSR
jgi:hypothetical protein